MPVVCAAVPAYKVAVARLNGDAVPRNPVLVVDRLERGHVMALDDEAYALGARRGMTLVQAAACAREASVVVDNPARGSALWERALDALDTASPLVEDAGEGTALLEMRGVAGSERAWLAAVRAAFATDEALRDLPVRVGLGSNRFVARMAARVHDGTIVHEGNERAFVSPLALHVLDLDAATLERLALLGVRTLGDLAALPHGPFVRRFGPEAARWHARARGCDDEPLVPRARRLSIERALQGQGSADREDQLLFALRALVARVADDVAFAGKRCGALRLELECEDGETVPLETTLAQPTAQGATMFGLLRVCLEGTVLRSPVTGLRLRAQRLEEGGAELSLFAGRDPDPEIVAVALARITAALGPNAVLRAHARQGNRYEARVAYEPFTASGLRRSVRATLEEAGGSCSSARSGTTGLGDASESATLAAPPTSSRPALPARLTKGTLTYRVMPPQPVEVRVQRGQPAFVGTHAILECAGPWRVDEGWWAHALSAATQPVAYDAYDVLLEDGTLERIVNANGCWYVGGTYD